MKNIFTSIASNYKVIIVSILLSLIVVKFNLYESFEKIIMLVLGVILFVAIYSIIEDKVKGKEKLKVKYQ